MATITTRSGKGSPLTNTEVDNNFTNLNTDKLETSGGSVTGDISFGDNDKAIFGAGNDLQIYHDGSNSIIKDNGTGNLLIQGATDIVLEDTSGANYFRGVSGSYVRLYHNNSTKLETQSTGIDVTGTVTADGLTVDGDVTISDTSVLLDLMETDTTDVNTRFQQSGGDLLIRTLNDAKSAVTTRLAIDHATGDISFYNTSGNAKFVWDAAAESLGIGTTSPSSFNSSGNNLVVGSGASGDSTGITIYTNSDATGHLLFADGTSGSTAYTGYIGYTHSNDYMSFHTNGGSERMRLDSSGRLGIATTSPTTELDVSGTVTQDANLLRAIDTTIADTAVDVFVYDTRKDSDGGAWRKRTQHTSWYNETLNTSTRGSRKEFPAVAVIVAESNEVTIYDGDDPTLPMWMVFETGRSPTLRALNWFTSGTPVISGVMQLNAKLSVASDGGVTIFDFVEDTSYLSYSGSTEYRLDRNTILFRNDYGSVSTPTDSPYFYFIISPSVNDVAMTVLPNAPIDSATGLPVPTIAVATDGGVSVIKDDGTVVDGSNTATMESIAISGDSLFIGETLYQDELFIVNNYAWLHDGFSQTNYYSQGFPAISTSSANDVINDVAGISDVDVAIGMTATLTLLQQDKDTKGNGMVAYATSDYNTGWMNGDIKLATLSDTDTTNVTGSELVNQDGTEWTTPTGWSHDGSGTLSYDGTGTVYLKAYDGLTLVSGEYYTVSFNVTANSGNFSVWVNSGTSATGAWGRVDFTSSTGVKSFTFQAGGTSAFLTFQNNNATHTLTATDISIRLAEEDRSVNGNGLQVFGTVTKDAVATGADLVRYRGWSSSNYLSQPYNSDFNFGTGDFAFIWWMDSPTASQDNIVWGLGDYSADNGLGCLALNSGGSGNELLLHLEGSNIGSSVTVTNHEGAGWICVAMVRRGGVLYGYRNGVLQGTATATQSFSLASETVQELTLGAGYSGGLIFSNGFNGGKLSLFRVSATAPSSEQIKKIYEDEKMLFQENAKATLYGSSDAVTALAYDDSTELLHAGTSAGRSVFQGLRRVDNTTDAVGSAISASNGMVADD